MGWEVFSESGARKTAVTGSSSHAVRAFRNTTQTINDITWTAVQFDQESFDYGGLHDTVTNNTRLTAQVSGVYSITANISWANSSLDERAIRLTANGSTVFAYAQQSALPTFKAVQTVTQLYYLSAGQYVEVEVYQNTGGTLDVSSGGIQSSFQMALVDTATVVNGGGVGFTESTTAFGPPSASSFDDGDLHLLNDWGVGGLLLRNVGSSSWEPITRPPINAGHGSGHRENLPWSGIPYISEGVSLQIDAGLSVYCTAGYAMIKGCGFPISAGSVGGLANNTRNYLFIEATYTGSVITGYTITSNTTGTAPSNSVMIGQAITSGGVVTSVANTVRGALAPGTVVVTSETTTQITQTSTGSFVPSPALHALNNRCYDPNHRHEMEFYMATIGISAGSLSQTYIDIVRDYGLPSQLIVERNNNHWPATSQYDSRIFKDGPFTVAGTYNYSIHGTQGAATTTDFRINNSQGRCFVQLRIVGAN